MFAARRACVCADIRDTLLHGQPMRRPSIKSMDIPPGMRAVVEQECNSSQVTPHAAARLVCHSTAQHSTAPHLTGQHSTAQHRMMVWV
jgi:hypothetical protein